jgi:hypothetical protein
VQRRPHPQAKEQHVNDVIEIPTADYTIRIRTRHGYENNPAPRVYVADEVAQSRNTDLVEYQRQEAELGDRRWAERGTYADVKLTIEGGEFDMWVETR